MFMETTWSGLMSCVTDRFWRFSNKNEFFTAFSQWWRLFAVAELNFLIIANNWNQSFQLKIENDVKLSKNYMKTLPESHDMQWNNG